MDAAALGRLIAARRKEQQMTQAELAALLHVTSKAVSRWERGVGFPDITTLEPLAAALDLRPAELLACARQGAAPADGEAAALLAAAAREQAAAQKRLRRGFWRLFAKALGMVAGLFLLFALAQYLVDFMWMRTGRITEYAAGLAGLCIRAARYLAAALAGLWLRAKHRALLAKDPPARRRWAFGLLACLPAVLLVLGPRGRLMRALQGAIYNLAAQRPDLWLAVVVCEAFCSPAFGVCVLECALLAFMPRWRPGWGGDAARQ